MITKQDWLLAVEEFGDEAFNRFLFDCGNLQIEFIGNNSINDIDFNRLKFKPLSDLFAHDIEIYGDNAYLMWSINYGYAMAGAGVQNAYSNEELIAEAKEFEIKRKTSAALPFDLERANKGDVVEQMYWPFGNWESMKTHKNWYLLFNNTQASAEGMSSSRLESLRMKYPPKLENKR